MMLPLLGEKGSPKELIKLMRGENVIAIAHVITLYILVREFRNWCWNLH